jgi:hypothetical protein
MELVNVFELRPHASVCNVYTARKERKNETKMKFSERWNNDVFGYIYN